MHWMFPDCDLMQRLWTDKYGMFYSNVKVVYKVESASRLKGKKKERKIHSIFIHINSEFRSVLISSVNLLLYIQTSESLELLA